MSLFSKYRVVALAGPPWLSKLTGFAQILADVLHHSCKACIRIYADLLIFYKHDEQVFQQLVAIGLMDPPPYFTNIGMAMYGPGDSTLVKQLRLPCWAFEGHSEMAVLAIFRARFPKIFYRGKLSFLCYKNVVMEVSTSRHHFCHQKSKFVSCFSAPSFCLTKNTGEINPLRPREEDYSTDNFFSCPLSCIGPKVRSSGEEKLLKGDNSKTNLFSTSNLSDDFSRFKTQRNWRESPVSRTALSRLYQKPRDRISQISELTKLPWCSEPNGSVAANSQNY